MIKVRYQYPWGSREVDYSEWQLVRGNPDGTKTVLKCYTQTEYDRMKMIWFNLVSEYSGYESYKEFNTNYFEVDIKKKEKMYCYIIGFVK